MQKQTRSSLVVHGLVALAAGPPHAATNQRAKKEANKAASAAMKMGDDEAANQAG